jgi:hypothetical protein
MAPDFGKPIHQLPLIPADILKKHRVHEPLDPRFRSAARLLQALWREDRGLPIGSYVNEDGKRRKLGSRIAEAAGRTGGNFLTPEIAHTARRETAYREIGALIDAERLRSRPKGRSRRLRNAVSWPRWCSSRSACPDWRVPQHTAALDVKDIVASGEASDAR